jgi:hypothetical protein
MSFVWCNLGPDEARKAVTFQCCSPIINMAIKTYRRKERFITGKAKCRMTGIKLKG